MDATSHFISRSISRALTEALADTPVVCLLGPRQSGKTTRVQSMASDRSYVSLDDKSYLDTATLDPSGFVDSLPRFVTLDEVQHVPELLPAIKRSVNRDRQAGRFLLTGSANLLLLPQVSESLAGRMEVIRLQPLTQSEKERAPGMFLRDFLQGKLVPEIVGEQAGTGLNVAARLIAGGYPEPLTRLPARARRWYQQYVRAIIDRDVQDVANIRCDIPAYRPYRGQILYLWEFSYNYSILSCFMIYYSQYLFHKKVCLRFSSTGDDRPCLEDDAVGSGGRATTSRIAATTGSTGSASRNTDGCIVSISSKPRSGSTCVFFPGWSLRTTIYVELHIGHGSA